jgi:hypothetical protein
VAIKAACLVVKAGLVKAVDDYVASSSPVHAKMMLSITESCANLMAFCEFISTSTESLETYGLPEKEAYNLTTRLGEAYFRACSNVRSGVYESFNANDRKSLAATVWFSVAQTLDIMDEFLKLDFKNHPTILGEYIKFIVQNTRNGEANTYDTKFVELEKRIKDAEKGVTTIANKIDLAGRAAATDAKKGMATKEDLKRLVTKEELNKLTDSIVAKVGPLA